MVHGNSSQKNGLRDGLGVCGFESDFLGFWGVFERVF